VERLFTPWRLAYVTNADRTPGCVLCQAREGEGDAGRLVVHRGERCFVVANLFPYSGGHVMVATYRHVATLGEATVDELGEMMALARRLESVFRETYRPDGINLGMNLGRTAGAGVADHIHMHLVPRWNGDTSFMTVIGETRVIPEEPAQACQRLRPYFEK
jgi:ATP adenylyltransferase